MDSSLLEQLGLSKGEAKVYLALVRIGSTKTGPVAIQARVSSSKVYKILDRLERKGLVGHVFKSNVKNYSALNPQRILDYVNEKEEKLNTEKKVAQELVSKLRAQFATSQKTEAAIYTGFIAVTNFIKGIVDELNAGEEYLVLGAAYRETPGIREFYKLHHARRARKGVKVKMLVDNSSKDVLIPQTKVLGQIRYLPNYLTAHMQIFIYHDKSFILIGTQEPIGFLLQSKEAAKSFETYFKALWKIAKP